MRLLTTIIVLLVLACNICFAQGEQKKGRQIFKLRPPAEAAPLPKEPDRKKEEDELIKFRAQRVRYTKDKIRGWRAVHAEYQDLIVDADQAEVDRSTGMLVARGNVTISRWGDKVSGTTLYYNLKTRDAVLLDVRGRGHNFDVQGKTLEKDVFFWGKRAVWTQRLLRVEDCVLTTCDLPLPDYHYHLRSREVVIKPRDRLIAKKSSLYVGKSAWFSLPSLVLSLRPRDRREWIQSLLPRIGSNRVEGLYFKEKINYLSGENNYGVAHIDWYSKTGLGRGIDHYLRLGDHGEGAVHLYQLRSQRENSGKYDVSGNVRYSLPGSWNLGVSYSSVRYENMWGLSPNIYGSTVNLGNSGKDHNFFTSLATSSIGSNVNSTFNTYYGFRISEKLSTRLMVDYASNASYFSRSSRWRTFGQLRANWGLFETDLDYDYRYGSRMYFVNRKPEVTLRTSGVEVGPVPVSASVSLGNYEEQPTNVSTARGDMRLSLGSFTLESGSFGSLDAGATLRQLFYGTGEAKYVLSSRAGWHLDVGDHLITRLDYFYQKPNGFSPIQYDYTGKYDCLSGGVEVQSPGLFRAGVTGGYDFGFKNFYNVLGRVQITPTKGVDLSCGSSYNPETRTFFNVDSQLSLNVGQGFSFQSWNYYDLVNKKFTYSDFVLTKEAHDWIGSIVYRSAQRELWMQFALKVFPHEGYRAGPDLKSPILPSR